MQLKKLLVRDDCTYYRIDKENKRVIQFDNKCSKWISELYMFICYISQERNKRFIDQAKMSLNPSNVI